MRLECGRLVGGGPPILLRGDHGLTSRASVASRSGSHEGECFGEVGGARVSSGGQSRLEDEKGRGGRGELGLGNPVLLCHLPAAWLRALVSSPRRDGDRPRSLRVS